MKNKVKLVLLATLMYCSAQAGCGPWMDDAAREEYRDSLKAARALVASTANETVEQIIDMAEDHVGDNLPEVGVSAQNLKEFVGTVGHADATRALVANPTSGSVEQMIDIAEDQVGENLPEVKVSTQDLKEFMGTMSHDDATSFLAILLNLGEDGTKNKSTKNLFRWGQVGLNSYSLFLTATRAFYYGDKRAMKKLPYEALVRGALVLSSIPSVEQYQKYSAKVIGPIMRFFGISTSDDTKIAESVKKNDVPVKMLLSLSLHGIQLYTNFKFDNFK